MTVPKQEGSYCKGDANVVYGLECTTFLEDKLALQLIFQNTRVILDLLGKRVIAQIISSASESQLCFTALFIAKVVEQPEYTGV